MFVPYEQGRPIWVDDDRFGITYHVRHTALPRPGTWEQLVALTTRVPLMTLVGRMDEGMSHLILLAVPLFVFLGLLIEMAGMASAMAKPRKTAGCEPRKLSTLAA